MKKGAIKSPKYPEIAIAELTPYERNARTHSDEQIEKIKNSIREFGFISPVIIDENNMILAGHGRVQAAKEMGMTEVPCRQITNLSYDQKRAYILADNKLSDMAGWDEEMLRQELAAITLDMADFGFDDIIDEPTELVEDDFDETEDKVEAVAKTGELYQLGEHRLLCGDSTNEEDVWHLMGEELADLVVTDPPYNVNVSNSDGLTIENDNMDEAAFVDFLDEAFANMSRHLKEGGAFYVWHATNSVVAFKTTLEGNGLEVKQELVWNKNQLVMGRQDYQWKHEPCFYGWKPGAAHYFTDNRTYTTVINDKPLEIDKLTREEAIKALKKVYALENTILNYDKPKHNDLHPTMKPLDLMGHQIKNSSRPGEIVLDLFGGSGSTLMACEQLGRKCRVMEYDPHYVDVIIARWEKMTGKKAIKL